MTVSLDEARRLDQPSLLEVGSRNPLLYIPHDCIVAWLRQLADQAGLADREMQMVQYMTPQDEPVSAVPKDLVVMLSSRPTRRNA